MEQLLGIPVEGWKALAVWFAVILLPWTYGLYFIRKIDRSGVERWGARPEGQRDGEEGNP
jgi:hypothetical protein